MMQNRQEFHRSAMIGGAITLIILSRLHQTMTPGELITFWIAVHVVSAGSVWWIIDKIKKCRDAWQSNHG